MASGWRAWAGLGACDAAALCVAHRGTDHLTSHLRFTWQAWHKLTLSHCRLCVAGVGHASLSHTPSVTDHLSPHHLSHTDSCHHAIFHTPTLSHAIFHTQLCHTPTLSHTIFHTPTLSHTIYHTPLCHTPPFIHHLSHITLSHTIFHKPSFTHHFVTYHL